MSSKSQRSGSLALALAFVVIVANALLIGSSLLVVEELLVEDTGEPSSGQAYESWALPSQTSQTSP